MWRWIKHWRDWAMSDIITPRRLSRQPQGLYFRSEKGGLTLDAQPIPWSADAVVIEALLRLPPAARRRGDYSVRFPGNPPVPCDALRPEDQAQRHRLYFRLPVPKSTCTAELYWRHHVLGSIELPVVTPEQFLVDLGMRLASTYVSIGGQTVASQTFVANQRSGLIATALVTSSTGLSPLSDLGLTATFRTAKATKQVVVDVPLTASQLAGREAMVTALPPKLPRTSGEWSVTWACRDRELVSSRLRAISPRDFYDSLRVVDTRFGIQTATGEFRVVRQMPSDGVVKAAPCFFVSSRENGMAGLADFEVVVQSPGIANPPITVPLQVLITDGPTPLAPSLFDMEALKHASAFELRARGRTLAMLSLSPIPAATLNAEGGFAPPADFSWSATADDELSDRLARLMQGG